MIGSTGSVRVFAYTLPTDMRKGFDGLYGALSPTVKPSGTRSRHWPVISG